MTHAVSLYVRFYLSPGVAKETLLQRGIDASYETARRWVIKFGPLIARNLRRQQGRSGDVWHLDEVGVSLSRRKYWLWRAVDQHGVVLDEVLKNKGDCIFDKPSGYVISRPH